MVKPTVVYLTIGAAMLQRGWLDRYIRPVAKPYIPETMVAAWGYVWAGLMFATAAANLGVALLMDHKTWLLFVGVFPLASKLGLFAVHYLSFRKVAMRNHRAEDAGLAAGAQLQTA
jgi:intracellular septation protein A